VPDSARLRAAPLAWTDRDGTAWETWDLREGQRVTPGAGLARRRLYVRVADRSAFACGINGRLYAVPADRSTLQWHLGVARDAGPIRRAHEDDAALAERVHAHRVAYAAAQRACQQRIWHEAEQAAGRRCLWPCESCGARDAERQGGTGAA
jgi:hypothetical protein